MNINLGLTIDLRAKHKSQFVYTVFKEMEVFFISKDYGSDIKSYTIGLKCVDIPEGYDNLFKEHKSLFIEDKTTKNKFTGENQRMVKTFVDYITLAPEEYEQFISSPDLFSLEVLKIRILASLIHLDNLPKKVKDFDKERFKADMLVFFKNFVQSYSNTSGG